MTATCRRCHASSADGGPMICERDGCPGEAARAAREQLERQEIAYARGAATDLQEQRERMAEWGRGVGEQ